MTKLPDPLEQIIKFAPDLFIIPGIVMLDSELQPLDTKVFGTIYWLEHLRDGKCTASNGTIGKIVGGTGPSVANSLTRLRDQEYITCQYDDKGNRTGINTLVQMKRTPSSNDDRGVHQMMNRRNNNKIATYTSEQQEQIEKVYDYWLKLMVVDPAIRAHGTTDEKRKALLKARKHVKLSPPRKAKILARISSQGIERVLKAVINISKSEFHRDGILSDGTQGDWTADLTWFTEKDERVEKWANKGGAN